MSKQILVLTGSPRKNGNSDLLAEAFAKGAMEAGNTVEFFHAGRRHIMGCKACNTCFSKSGACSFEDDFNELAEYVEGADMIVIVSPLYWFTFPAQLKAALDKLYAFLIGGKTMGVKESYLIACAGGKDMSDFNAMTATYKLIAKFLNWEERGIFLVPGVSDKGSVKQTDALARIEAIGRQI